MKVGRHLSIDVGEGEDAVKVRLKSWSAGKLFFLVREFWSLLENAIENIDLRDLDELKLVGNLVGAFIQSEQSAAKLVTNSIDDPKGLTEAEVLEWDANDFLIVVSKIIEQNVSEELVKNFRGLLESFSIAMARKKATEPAKEETSETEAETTGAETSEAVSPELSAVGSTG